MTEESTESMLGKFAIATAALVKTILLALWGLMLIIFACIIIILAAALVFVASHFLLRHGTELVSSAEFLLRCEVYPNSSGYLNFLNFLADCYEKVVCWFNSIGLIGRLISTRFLFEQTAACVANGGSFLRIIEAVFSLLQEFFFKTTEWLLSNPFIKTFPLYPVLADLIPISNILRLTLDCLCEILDPLWKFIQLILQDNNLFCFINQFINALISFPQIFITTTIDTFLTITNVLFKGSILKILTLIYYLGSDNYYLYDVFFDKLVASFDFVGYYLDDVVKYFICIIVSEAEEGPNGVGPVEVAYQQCMVTAENVEVFCIVSKILSILTRTAQCVFQYITGIFRVLNPEDDFRWNVWNPNIVWDSIRNPLPLNATSTDDPWLIQDSSSVIEVPYFNPNQTSNFTSCNYTQTVSNFSVVCIECLSFGNTSLETCLCTNFATEIDNLIGPAIGFRLFKPIFCDTLFSVVRVMTALAKFVIDLLRTIGIGEGAKVFDLLASQVTYDRIVDEIGGPPNSIGGLIYFPNALLSAFLPDHPDLQCIPSVITFTLKFLSETLRLILYLIQNIFADIRDSVFSLQPPFPHNGSYTTNYICIYPNGGENCANLEVALKWLRIPRDQNLNFQNQVPLITIPENNTIGAYQRGALECLCFIINGKFLDSFGSEIPSLQGFDLPDICCTIYNFLRTIISTSQFLINLLISLVQTIFELTIYDDPFNRIFILNYLACLTNTSSGPCSNINSVLNDLEAILQCGCLTINDILGIPAAVDIISDTKPLECTCNLFSALAAVVTNLLISVRDTAQLILGIFDCLDLNTGQFKHNTQCDIFLPLVAIDIFDRINLAIQRFGLALEEFTCVFSTVFYYDCLNKANPSCIAIDFEGGVLQQCPTYFPNETIGNSLPTPQQLNDCIIQCGPSICNFVYNTVQLEIRNAGVNSSLTCPNPCTDPNKCRPNDKLPLLMRSLYNIISSIIDTFIKIITDIIVFGVQNAGNQSPGTISLPTTISGYLDLFLTGLGNSLFGAVNSNGDVITWGVFQYFGDALSCLVGPPNCRYGNIPGVPSCFGDIFVTIGNVFAPIYDNLKTVITSALGIVEAIITGKTGDIGDLFKNFFQALFRFLFRDLIKGATALLDALIALISAIFDTIFPGTYDFFSTILTALFAPLRFVLQGIYDILKFFGAIKRTVNEDEDEETAQEFDKKFSELWSNFTKEEKFNNNNNDNNAQGKPKIFLHEILQNFMSKIPSSSKKRFNQQKNNTFHSSPTDFQLQYNLTNEEMYFIQRPDLLVSLMTNNTYCRKAMYIISPKGSFENMTLYEELIFKVCYSLVLFPIINNANPNRIFDMPLDLGYNTERMITIFDESLQVSKLYQNWNSMKTHLFSFVYNNTFNIETNNNNNNNNNTKKRLITQYNNLEGEIINTTNYTSFFDFIQNTKYNSSYFILSFLKNMEYIQKNQSLNDFTHYINLVLNKINSSNSTIKNTNVEKFSWYIYGLIDELDFNKQQPSTASKRSTITGELQKIQEIFEKEEEKGAQSAEKKEALLHAKKEKEEKGGEGKKEEREEKQEKEEGEEKGEKEEKEEEREKDNNWFSAKNINDLRKINLNKIKNLIYVYRARNTSPRIGNNFFDNQKRTVFNNNNYNGIIEKPTLNFVVKQLYNTITITIPLTIKYWFFTGNEKSITTLKRFSNNTNNNNKDQSQLLKGENILKLALRNIYFERIKLICDSISTITYHYMNKIKNHNTLGNITFERIKKRAVSSVLNREYEKLINANNASNNNNNIDDTSIKRNSIPISVSIPCRPSLPERIVKIHTILKNIRWLGSNIPNLPDSIVELSDEISEEINIKRRLVTINCSCNCSIVENFVQQALDIATYCYEKQFLGILDPLNNSIYKGPFIDIIYYNSTDVFTFPENIINNWLGFDLSATIIRFFENTNINRESGSVGLLYFITSLPIPFISRSCKRINLTCQLGVGLTGGIIIALLIVFFTSFVLYLISPPAAGIIDSLIIGAVFGTIWLFFMTLVLNIAWGYEVNCYTPTDGTLISFLVPFVAFIPLLPECAAREVYNLLANYLIVSCPLISFSNLGFQNFVVNGTESCPVCPKRVQLLECSDYGIQSPLTILGMAIVKYIPPLAAWLQNSCLVRGNCLGFLFGAGDRSLTNDGILGALFTGFNATQLANGSDPISNTCFWMNSLSIFSSIVIIILFIIVLIYVIIISIDVIVWLVALFSIIWPRKDPSDLYYEERARRILG
jgi:hypothetical protein